MTLLFVEGGSIGMTAVHEALPIGVDFSALVAEIEALTGDNTLTNGRVIQVIDLDTGSDVGGNVIDGNPFISGTQVVIPRVHSLVKYHTYEFYVAADIGDGTLVGRVTITGE